MDLVTSHMTSHVKYGVMHACKQIFIANFSSYKNYLSSPEQQILVFLKALCNLFYGYDSKRQMNTIGVFT